MKKGNGSDHSMNEAKPMNVLLLSPFFRPNLGGVETHLDDLTEYLCKRNYRVFVVTYVPLTVKMKGVPMREKYTNLEIHRVKWFGHGLFFLLEPYFILEFLYLFPALFAYAFTFVFRNRVDVIHAHGLVGALIAKLLAKMFKVRTVMSIHGIYNLKSRPIFGIFVRWTLSSFDRILALSEKSKRDFMEAGIPEEKIAIYIHWIDQDLFKPPKNMRAQNELKKKLRIDNMFTVLFVGRLTEYKGAGVLVKVAKGFPGAVKFMFVGSGPMENVVKKASERDEKIIFMGRVPVEKLIECYGAADLMVVPSQDEEGFARVVLEALSCGTPVIASNKGCLPEMIDPSVGKVLNPTPQEISDEILHYYLHRSEIERLTPNCRRYALEKFSERNGVIIERAYVRGKT